MKTQIEVLIGLKGQKIWHVKKDLFVDTRYGRVHIFASFHHDRYSYAPDLTEELPAIVHDWLRKEKKFDDGSPCTLKQSDRVLRDLIVECDAKLVIGWITIPSRKIASIYYFFVRIGSIILKFRHG